VGMVFEVVFGGIFFCRRGRTDQVRTTTILGTIFRGVVFLGGSYNSTDLARFSRQNFCGTVLGVVSGFLLAAKCNFVADILS
jgi:hypothetical protein